MKWFVSLLVLLNVALFGYFNRQVILPVKTVIAPEMQPEKLKILAQADLDAMPKRATDAPDVTALPVVAATCYRWGDFGESNLPAAQATLAKFDVQSTLNQETVARQDNRFWVYYPPMKTAALAEQKANEIRALGVQELYIVQDSQWRNAISFGLFNDEDLASNLLKDLQAKGVKNAEKALRGQGRTTYSLNLQEVKPEILDELKKVTPEFVGSALVEAACAV